MHYTVIFASRVDSHLLKHTEFLARVSIPAAKAFRNAFAQVLEDLATNPLRFPMETDQNLPEGLYRKALFAKRYKALFSVAGSNVYLDAVIDCRQDTRQLYSELNQ